TWAGGDKGLFLFAGQRFLAVIGSDGQRFFGTKAIIENKAGELWLHGVYGIARIGAAEVDALAHDPDHRPHIEVYDYHDGIVQAPNFIRPLPSGAAEASGRLWFSTGDFRLISFDPTDIAARNGLP